MLGLMVVLVHGPMAASEDMSRKDIIVEELYKLETNLSSKNKRYLLRVIEFEKERSHFYGFELIRIIHSKETNIGVVNNKTIAYKNLILPSLVLDSKKKSWTEKLSSLSDKTFFGGEENDVLNIKIDNLQSLKTCYLIFRANLRASYPRISKISKQLEKTSSSERGWINSFKKIVAASLGTLAAGKTMRPENVFGAKDVGSSIKVYIDGKKRIGKYYSPKRKILFRFS